MLRCIYTTHRLTHSMSEIISAMWLECNRVEAVERAVAEWSANERWSDWGWYCDYCRMSMSRYKRSSKCGLMCMSRPRTDRGAAKIPESGLSPWQRNPSPGFLERSGEQSFVNLKHTQREVIDEILFFDVSLFFPCPGLFHLLDLCLLSLTGSRTHQSQPSAE